MAEFKYPKIGRDIRNKRRLKRQTVIDLLKKEGVSISINTLSNYESGITNTPASVLMHLANIYQTDIENLYDWESRTSLKGIYFPDLTYGLSRVSSKLIKKREELYVLHTNIVSPYISFKYVILEEDDPYMHLPKKTRLVYKEVDGNPISINTEFDYFIIAMDVTEKYKTISKTFLTKAKRVEESQKPKLVYYINHVGEEAFMSEQKFKQCIQGVITKIIIDIHTKNTENR